MSESLPVVADGVWSIHHREFSTGGLQVGTRSNVIRLTDGTLALHAPGPLTDAQLGAIRGLGPVSTIVAPALLHHLSLVKVQAAFPDARLLASPGVKAKQPGLRVDEELGGAVPAALQGVAEMLVLDGCPKLEERVFFLPKTRTLLGVDLAFNIRAATGFLRFAMWINNANDRFCVTRLARSQYIGDTTAAARSVRRMADAWDIERVVVSHGEVLETGGREALREAWAFA